MLKVLRNYEEDNYLIEELSYDGITVSHINKTLIFEETTSFDFTPTIEEEILFETKYQTLLLEMGVM